MVMTSETRGIYKETCLASTSYAIKFHFFGLLLNSGLRGERTALTDCLRHEMSEA